MLSELPSPAALADHLRHQARIRPQAPALIYQAQQWTYGELLACCSTLLPRQNIDGHHQCGEANGQAFTVPPFQLAGTTLDLALHAWACSLQARTFWPREKNVPVVPEPACPANDIALLIATSGSEGQARIVPLSPRQLDHAAAAANQRLPLHPGDLWLACLPLYHIGGQSILWRSTRAGATVLLHEDFSVSRLADDLARHPVSHLSLVPAMLAQLLANDVRPPASLRHVLVGGAALAVPLYERAQAAGWPLHPSYGMSETAAQIATWTTDDGPWQPGLVGRPLAGSEIAIGDDGRIRLRSPQLMAGYLGLDRAASRIDADGWFTTGDLGKIDAEGRLTVIGRADDMLISGGRNIHPLEIENCLAAHPEVRDVAVTSRPDPVWGDRIVALVVGPANSETLLAHARAHLPPPALPREFHFLDHLPRNATGKLCRDTLRQLVSDSQP